MGPRFGFGQSWRVMAQHPWLMKIFVGCLLAVLVFVMLKRRVRENEAKEAFRSDCVTRAVSEDACDDLLSLHHSDCFAMSWASGGRFSREHLDLERYVECVRISPAAWTQKRRQVLQQQQRQQQREGSDLRL